MFCLTERRQAEAARIREKYPDRIPVMIFNTINFIFNSILGDYLVGLCHIITLYAFQVIVEKAERSDIPDIDKKK